jgi:hypothetical protein
MRMMLKLRLPVQKGSETIRNGKLPKVIGDLLEKTRAECAYFGLEEGRRTMWAVFDLDAPARMVPLLEPALMELDAGLELSPVMTADDLEAGFAAIR